MAPQHLIELEGIVDTGAIYSVVPRRILEELGVKPVERRRFKAFGGYVERDLGEVGIELMGRRRTITVIFGETDDAIVLGVTALESFGLEVDPVRGTLKEAELLMLTFQLESPFPSTNEIECTIKTQHQLRSGE
jgi:clan AA aspartic protease